MSAINRFLLEHNLRIATNPCVSPDFCLDWQALSDQLRAGKTPDEVRAYFVDKYGEWILLSPRATGLNLVVYLAPLAAVLVGGFVVWRTVRRWTGPPSAGSADQPGA